MGGFSGAQFAVLVFGMLVRPHQTVQCYIPEHYNLPSVNILSRKRNVTVTNSQFSLNLSLIFILLL